MTFNTYYWHGALLDDPDLRSARDALSTAEGQLPRKRAFQQLLTSGRDVPVAIAMDHFDYAQSLTRHGCANEFDEYRAEVLTQARALLQRPPLSAAESGAAEDGANHTSALGALGHVATADDVPIVAEALRSAAAASAVEAAMAASRRVLQQAPHPDQRLTDVLTALIIDRLRKPDDRVAALRALAGSPDPSIMDMIAGLLDADLLRLQIGAARILALRDLARYRSQIEATVAGWPADAPYPADEVRDLLDDDPDDWLDDDEDE